MLYVLCLSVTNIVLMYFQMIVNGKQFSLPHWDMKKPVVSLTVDDEVFILQIHGRGSGPVWTIGFQGATYEFKLVAPYTQSLLDLMPLPKSVKKKLII